jgi:hypothetical protein
VSVTVCYQIPLTLYHITHNKFLYICWSMCSLADAYNTNSCWLAALSPACALLDAHIFALLNNCTWACGDTPLTPCIIIMLINDFQLKQSHHYSWRNPKWNRKDKLFNNSACYFWLSQTSMQYHIQTVAFGGAQSEPTDVPSGLWFRAACWACSYSTSCCGHAEVHQKFKFKANHNCVQKTKRICKKT